ncbi:UNVERIFIED_CONTAM: hypothetical protein PYX00_002595 [Menopon gallinae]|uniref:Proteasome assembly chaperone 2 n=1 Tax=Menopon gallinae TaxID=328185 RepID=A0AAW2IH75_9NEOP
MEFCERINLRNYSLIVPSVSVGNVGQLAVDLLINSLGLKKLCYVWHESVIPVAGGDPFGNSKTISTGCEVFYSEKLELVVMQIRSGIMRTKSDFPQFLCSWVKEEGIRQVIILTGSSAHERRDEQLVGEPLRFIFCPLTPEAERNNAFARQWRGFEVKEIHSRDRGTVSGISYIPGSGIALKLYRQCVREKIICSVLIEFCSDGNNAPDAFKLADYLNDWLKIKETSGIEQWTPPPSWIFLFGPMPPTEIFN